MDTLYCDSAATSWPKPPGVSEAMRRFLEEIGGSPGRSGHRLSIEAGRVVFGARARLAALFGAGDPLRIALTRNATEALKFAILGLLSPGDHVVTSGIEHNSVMRPLRHLQRSGLEVSVVPCSAAGELDPADCIPLIKKNTKAIFLTHASNVTGTIMPLREVGKIARERRIVFCVDAAQTAGAVPIDVDEMLIDLLAFTGHKSLLGPQGTGGLFVREGLEKRMRPVVMGGTGSRSEHEEQPDFMPDMFESGTPNAVGIAGLSAALDYVSERTVAAIREHEVELTRRFIEGITPLPGIRLYGPPDAARRTAVVSFTIEGMRASAASLEFDERFGIMSRPGLHCAPAAHRTIGTFPGGAIRFSFGCFNTIQEIMRTVEAVGSLAAEKIISQRSKSHG